jgi:hypothetical protein
MQVLQIETDGTARVILLDGEDVLGGLQRLVDGPVTCISTDTYRSGLVLDVWVNEEGLLREDFAENEAGLALTGQWIVGPVVVADVDDYGDTRTLSAVHLNLLADKLGVKVDDNNGAGYTLDALDAVAS